MERKTIGDFEARRIARALMKRHAASLAEDEWFEVSGHRSPVEVYTRVILRNESDTFYYPVECRIDLTQNSLPGPVAAQELLFDFQDYYFQRYFEEERELYLTIDWSDIRFAEYTLQARGQILNRRFERLADRLLAGQLLPEELEAELGAARKKR